MGIWGTNGGESKETGEQKGNDYDMKRSSKAANGGVFGVYWMAGQVSIHVTADAPAFEIPLVEIGHRFFTCPDRERGKVTMA
jgi:hypothetical protein